MTNDYVVDTQNDDNVCTTTQVEAAKAKGWTVCDSNGLYYVGSDPETIPTGISISPSSKTIKEGETFTLSYTLTPSNAETTVTWSSDDSSIASVSSSGKVTAKKAGSTYINATTDNGKTAWCKVTVKNEMPAGIAIDATNFPDTNFRNYLLGQDYGRDEIITKEEISNVLEMDISYKKIENVKGIEFFTALEKLNCTGNELVSLDLSRNSSLKELDVRMNSRLLVFDISSNTNLTKLDCAFMGLTVLNVSKNVALIELDCDNNNLKNLDVTHNVNLTRISCYHNQIRNKAMDDLINSLHINKTTKCNLYIFGGGDNPDQYEKNALTDNQVAKIYEKGWIPYYAPNFSFVPYPKPSQTSIGTVINRTTGDMHIFNLNGQRLSKPRKGINIIGGKKVVVK